MESGQVRLGVDFVSTPEIGPLPAKRHKKRVESDFGKRHLGLGSAHLDVLLARHFADSRHQSAWRGVVGRGVVGRDVR